ncbi:MULTISPECIES: hypothetical protein [Pseudomonas]|uniref:hypothetical protein n=1 Tax=Pseudomonas TaxID=286 RepID=UPI001E50F247|nr:MULTISPECIES: hypothetical protein [Pseudomonas]MCE1118709.1 hypothetical protein [Pseudomonas sp. NMI795_08]
MQLAGIIIEQLDNDGSVVTLEMDAGKAPHLMVALANEYQNDRSGPFHFLRADDERKFNKRLAQCVRRRLGPERLIQHSASDFTYHSHWRGLRTCRHHWSYYALSLPLQVTPVAIRASDPSNGHEYRHRLIFDKQKERYVVYLGFDSSTTFVDFDLTVDFSSDKQAKPPAPATTGSTFPLPSNDFHEGLIAPVQRQSIIQFMTTNYINNGVAGAIGPNASSQNETLQQVYHGGASSLEYLRLAQELELLLGKLCLRLQDEPGNADKLQFIANAQRAALQQNEHGVMENLSKAGRWAFNVATDVGTQLAAEFLKRASGL